MVKMTLKWLLQTKMAVFHSIFGHGCLRLFLWVTMLTKFHVAKCDWVWGLNFGLNMPRRSPGNVPLDFFWWVSFIVTDVLTKFQNAQCNWLWGQIFLFF